MLNASSIIRLGITLLILTATACAGIGIPAAKAPPAVETQASAATASAPTSTGNPASSASAPAGTARNSPVERVVQELRPSVVRVNVSGSSQGGSSQRSPFGGSGQTQGNATGMVLDDQGHILTNNHVVTLEGTNPVPSVAVALPNGKTAPAAVVGTDPQTDLAVLQLGSGDRAGLTPIQWADSSAIDVGEAVVAIGYALNLGGAPTVTTGVVSAIDRSIPETDATISGAIQTDAAVNSGNSGGPLLDLDGKVVGVNTAGLAGTVDQPVQGVNFAISSYTAQPVTRALIAQGHVSRGYMGVGVTDITPELAQSDDLGISSGAGVGQVTTGSPADQAGVRPGDVITKVGDVAINSSGDLTMALTKYGPGQQVPVVVERDRNKDTMTITLGQRPASG